MNLQDHQQAVGVRGREAMWLDDRVAAVEAVHAEIDQHTSLFAQQTGLACPEGCGRCCHSPEVETTVSDLFPLALKLFEFGVVGEILQRLADRGDDSRCVLFNADSLNETLGRCSMYQWRPSICRLFGFAGRRDADGLPQFNACRIHSQTMPETVSAAKQAVADHRIALPILSDLAGKVHVVAPGGSCRPLPINVALRDAIHNVGLHVSMMEAQREDDTDGTTPAPRVPPLRAA